MSIKIKIEGLGEVPSFKNTKSIFRNRKTGKPMIATKSEKKAWMDRAIASIESQLRLRAQIEGGATSTALHQRFWIASCVPLDDARQIVRSLHIETIDVQKGEEGAEITIEKI